MIKQEFETGTKVFKFYIDKETSTLRYRYLPISFYDYMDGMQWVVIDEYTLIEYTFKRKFFFFKETKQRRYNYPATLIDPDYLTAKAKFLYQYFMYYGGKVDFDVLVEDDPKLYSVIRKHYDDLLIDYPELMLKMKTGIIDVEYKHFWR